MKGQNKKTTFRNLIIFTIAVIASGWIGRGLDILMGNPSKDSLGILLWLIMPLAVSIILRIYGGDGWKDIGLKPSLKANIRWYIVSLLTFPFITILVLAIGSTLGWVSFKNFDLNLYSQAFIIALIPNFIKNIPEEFVWRGYLTPKLYSLKINDFALYLANGLIWGLWHVPYYLFFLDNSSFQSVTTLSKLVFIPLTIVVMITWSIVFVELRLLTKSVWPLVVMHMIEDSFVNPLFLGGFIKILQGKGLWISPIYGIVSIIFFTAFGLILRNVRKKTIINSYEND